MFSPVQSLKEHRPTWRGRLVRHCNYEVTFSANRRYPGAGVLANELPGAHAFELPPQCRYPLASPRVSGVVIGCCAK